MDRSADRPSTRRHGDDGRRIRAGSVSGSETPGDRGVETGEQPILTAADIEMGFGDVAVLDGVSITLHAGRVTALVGANGSGKTTLLRIVAGLLSPDVGTIRLATEHVTCGSHLRTDPSLERSGRDNPGRARIGEGDRLVGYLPQHPAFRESFTVAETLRFYADLVDGDTSSVADRLAGVGLREVADRRVGGLSGGMTRLLGLAQATVGDPPVVILDEPTSGLDPRMTAHVFSAVEAMAGTGQAVLLATHDLAAVEAVVDDVVVLDRGAVAARGPLEDLCIREDVDDLPAVFAELVGASDGITVRAGSPKSTSATSPPGS
jgi:ABC-type multidrug transport system ATPase subunit